MRSPWTGIFTFDGEDPDSKDKVHIDIEIMNDGRSFVMNRRRSVPKSHDLGLERMRGVVVFLDKDRIRLSVNMISWMVMNWNGSETGSRNYDDENDENGDRLEFEASVIEKFNVIEIQGMRLTRHTKGLPTIKSQSKL